MRGEYSLADIAAATGNGNNGNNAFDNPLWALIFLSFLGRNGMGGLFGGNGGGTPNMDFNIGRLATTNDVASGFSTSEIMSDLNDILLGQANLQQTLCQGFSGVNQTIVTNGYESRLATQDLSRQIGDCCCDIRSGIQQGITQGVINTNAIQSQIASCCCDIEKMNMQNRFDAQTYNCNTLQAIDKLGDRIINRLTQDKIDTLQAENQALRFQASQSAQNAFITANQDAQTAELIRRLGADCPIPAYVVNAPTPVSFATNCCGQIQYGNGCGCNNF